MPGIIRCPSCSQEIDSNSRFCVHCTARICPGCHGPVPPRAVYCPHCGFAVGPAMPGAAEQQPPTPPPPPRPLPSSQGGIIGPQPRQQPPYPQTPSTPMPSAVPQAPVPQPPIPQPIPPRQYGTDGQPPGASGSPGAMPYVSAQQPSVSTQKTFMDTGPIRVRRFPTALVAILIIAFIGLLGFAAFKAGWLEAPLSNVQEFVSEIKLPQWLPIGPKDTTPPTIQNVSVSNITMTGAVITWQTDEPATSQVMICDPGGGCTWTELDENLVTNHSVSLIDLKPNTAYHFTATSTDAKGNQAIAEGDLTTSAQAGATTPTISEVKVSNITDLSTTIGWVTDKPATSQVEYGTTDAYGSTTPLDQKLTTSHSATLAGLKPSTTYHFKVKSKDASGTEAAFQDQTFTTRGTVAVAAEVGPEVGKLAPDFTLQDNNGKTVKLSDFRGKIVMVKFWVDSQSARTELPLIQAFFKKWSGRELVILAINWKQSPEEVQKFVNDRGLTFTVLLDPKGEVAAKYRVSPSVYPTTFFINSQGIIKERQDVPLRNEIQIEGILNSTQ